MFRSDVALLSQDSRQQASSKLERVRHLAGTLEILSDGHGTRVAVRFATKDKLGEFGQSQSAQAVNNAADLVSGKVYFLHPDCRVQSVRHHSKRTHRSVAVWRGGRRAKHVLLTLGVRVGSRMSNYMLVLARSNTTSDRGATEYLECVSGTPALEKSFGLLKLVSTILRQSCGTPSWISNNSSSQ